MKSVVIYNKHNIIVNVSVVFIHVHFFITAALRKKKVEYVEYNNNTESETYSSVSVFPGCAKIQLLYQQVNSGKTECIRSSRVRSLWTDDIKIALIWSWRDINQGLMWDRQGQGGLCQPRFGVG